MSGEFDLLITFLESRFFVVLFFAVQTRATHWNHLFACRVTWGCMDPGVHVTSYYPSNSSICTNGWLVWMACVDNMFQFWYSRTREVSMKHMGKLSKYILHLFSITLILPPPPPRSHLFRFLGISYEAA